MRVCTIFQRAHRYRRIARMPVPYTAAFPANPCSSQESSTSISTRSEAKAFTRNRTGNSISLANAAASVSSVVSRCSYTAWELLQR